MSKYIIVDTRNGDYFKDDDGRVIVIDSFEEACCTCGMYEFENVWVCELKYNHIEDESRAYKITKEE